MASRMLEWHPMRYADGVMLPKGRWGHSLTCVNNRYFVIIGGLRSGEMLSDTWIYDIETRRWSRPTVYGTPPTPRWGHSATLIAPHILLLLGGREGSKPMALGEYYTLNLKTTVWIRHETLKPSPKSRYAHGAVWLSNSARQILVFGGHGGRSRYYNDLNILQMPLQSNATNATPSQGGAAPGMQPLQAPSPGGFIASLLPASWRKGFASRDMDPAVQAMAGADGFGSTVVAPSIGSATTLASSALTTGDKSGIGSLATTGSGAGSGRSGLWTYSADAAAAQQQLRPAFPASTVSSVDGQRAQPAGFSPTAVQNPQQVAQALWLTPSVTGTPPAKRSGHTTTLQSGRLFVIGGYNGKDILQDMGVLHIPTWTWSTPMIAGSGLPPLVGHSADAVPGTNQIIVFGGSVSATELSCSLYVIDTDVLASTALHQPQAPAPRFWHRTCVVVAPPEKHDKQHTSATASALRRSSDKTIGMVTANDMGAADDVSVAKHSGISSGSNSSRHRDAEREPERRVSLISRANSNVESEFVGDSFTELEALRDGADDDGGGPRQDNIATGGHLFAGPAGFSSSPPKGPRSNHPSSVYLLVFGGSGERGQPYNDCDTLDLSALAHGDDLTETLALAYTVQSVNDGGARTQSNKEAGGAGQGGYRAGGMSSETLPGMRPALVSRIAPSRAGDEESDGDDAAADGGSRLGTGHSDIGAVRVPGDKSDIGTHTVEGGLVTHVFKGDDSAADHSTVEGERPDERRRVLPGTAGPDGGLALGLVTRKATAPSMAVGMGGVGKVGVPSSGASAGTAAAGRESGGNRGPADYYGAPRYPHGMGYAQPYMPHPYGYAPYGHPYGLHPGMHPGASSGMMAGGQVANGHPMQHAGHELYDPSNMRLRGAVPPAAVMAGPPPRGPGIRSGDLARSGHGPALGDHYPGPGYDPYLYMRSPYGYPVPNAYGIGGPAPLHDPGLHGVDYYGNSVRFGPGMPPPYTSRHQHDYAAPGLQSDRERDRDGYGTAGFTYYEQERWRSQQAGGASADWHDQSLNRAPYMGTRRMGSSQPSLHQSDPPNAPPPYTRPSIRAGRHDGASESGRDSNQRDDASNDQQYGAYSANSGHMTDAGYSTSSLLSGSRMAPMPAMNDMAPREPGHVQSSQGHEWEQTESSHRSATPSQAGFLNTQSRQLSAAGEFTAGPSRGGSESNRALTGELYPFTRDSRPAPASQLRPTAAAWQASPQPSFEEDRFRQRSEVDMHDERRLNYGGASRYDHGYQYSPATAQHPDMPSSPSGAERWSSHVPENDQGTSGYGRYGYRESPRHSGTMALSQAPESPGYEQSTPTHVERQSGVPAAPSQAGLESSLPHH